MNRIVNFLLENKCIFNFFEQVYLFGSSLNTNEPNDVDILLVYEKSKVRDVKIEKAKVKKILSNNLRGLNIDFTTLNQYELMETSFLEKTLYKKIKG